MRDRFKLSLSVFTFLVEGNNVLLLKRSNTGWMDGYFSVPAGALDGNEWIGVFLVSTKDNKEIVLYGK